MKMFTSAISDIKQGHIEIEGNLHEVYQLARCWASDSTTDEALSTTDCS